MIAIGSLTITDFEEHEEVGRSWFIFVIDGAKYQMVLTQRKSDGVYYMNGIYHDGSGCSFCPKDSLDASRCDTLEKRKMALFEEFKKRSKYRIRWLSRTFD